MLDDVRRCSAMYGDVDDVYRHNYVWRRLAMSGDTRRNLTLLGETHQCCLLFGDGCDSNNGC